MGADQRIERRFDRSLLPPAPNLDFEQPLWQTGVLYVAGIDEAGRGALAGPVAAAAVILPPEPAVMERLSGVRDSKQMTARQRQAWAVTICQAALAWGVGMASAAEIDTLGILPATRLAAQRSLEQLRLRPVHLLLDALTLPLSTPQTSLIKGDCRSLSIAAASVLAKTTRDALMADLATTYPGYGLAQHKGYGTPTHLAALQHLGPVAIHRKTFRRVLPAPFELEETIDV